MHTSIHRNGMHTTAFHYNSDFSRDVLIDRRDSQGNLVSQSEVPACHILEFVAEYVRSQRISNLENQTVQQLLGT